MKKLIRDGKVAVIMGYNYCEWFTLNEDHPGCIFDTEIITIIEQYEAYYSAWTTEADKEALAEALNYEKKNIKIEKIALKNYGKTFDLSSSDSLYIEWINQGEKFIIQQCDDGGERIQLLSDLQIHEA